MVEQERMRTSAPTTSRRPRAVVVLAAVTAAVVANLVVYAVGRVAGGAYEVTSNGEVVTVTAVTVAGFSAVPLGLGLVVVALLARWRWVPRVALVVAPLLAVVTIGIMTVPADLDTVSTVALACCHLTLVPISVLAIRRLRR